MWPWSSRKQPAEHQNPSRWAVAPANVLPDAAEPATYDGARLLTYEVRGRPVPAGTMQCWSGSGRVALVWPDPCAGSIQPGAVQGFTADPTLDLVVLVQAGWNPWGPRLHGWRRLESRRVGPGYSVSWPDLVRALGVTLPWWPTRMQMPELILAWRPDASPVTALAAPDLDVRSLRRAALDYDEHHPAHRTLMTLAREAGHRAYAAATQELDEMRSEWWGLPPATVEIAAQPVPVEPVDYDDLDEPTRRAGWAELFGRTDSLATACMNAGLERDGGQDFPDEYRDPR